MAVKIRLSRHGSKKKPVYRIVVANSESPRDGRFIEQLGWYDPLKNPHQVKLDLARIDYWLSVGAQPSETAQKLIDKYRASGAAEGAES